MLSSQRLWPSWCSFCVGFMFVSRVSLGDCQGLELRLCGLDDLVGREAEFRLQLFERCRGAEGAHRDDRAGQADVTFPTEGRGLLDRDAMDHLRWQDGVAVLLRLALE